MGEAQQNALDSACESLQALQQSSEKAFPEWAPFAYSLASRLQEEHTRNRLAPGDTLWHIAVEQLLLPVVDSDYMVRSPFQFGIYSSPVAGRSLSSLTRLTLPGPRFVSFYCWVMQLLPPDSLWSQSKKPKCLRDAAPSHYEIWEYC